MVVNKSFEFKNTAEITSPREHIHAQDLHGMLGGGRGFGIRSGCGVSRATNTITIAAGSLLINGTIVAFAGDSVVVDDVGMSAGQHRWTNIHVTPGNAIGSTDGTSILVAEYPVKTTDLTNIVICSALKIHGTNLVDEGIRSSVVDLSTSSVLQHADVTDFGSGIIISDSERTALHAVYTDAEAISAVEGETKLKLTST